MGSGTGGLLAAQSGLQGFQTGAQFFGARAAAEVENDFREKAEELAQIAADQALDEEGSRLQLASIQDAERVAAQSFAVRRAALKQRSTARVAASDAGVSGTSVGDLLSDFDRHEEEALQAIRSNQQRREDQRRAQARGLVATRDARVAGSKQGRVRKPSIIEGAALLGGQALTIEAIRRRSLR